MGNYNYRHKTDEAQNKTQPQIHHFCRISYCLWEIIGKICGEICNSSEMIGLSNKVTLFITLLGAGAPAFTIVRAEEGRSLNVIFLIPGQRVFDCVTGKYGDRMDRSKFYSVSESLLKKISSVEYAISAIGKMLTIKRHDTAATLESSLPEELPRYILDQVIEKVRVYSRASRVKYFYYEYFLKDEHGKVANLKDICKFFGFDIDLNEICNRPDCGIGAENHRYKPIWCRSCGSQLSFILNDLVFLCCLLEKLFDS